MALKSGQDNEHVVALRSHILKSRRGSFASLASNSTLDKEALSQVLDEIHQTASNSGSLTAFNEYTSPPASASNADNKSITGDIQGGLSGLYTRLRNSVGSSKEILNLESLDGASYLRASSTHPKRLMPKSPSWKSETSDVSRPQGNPAKQLDQSSSQNSISEVLPPGQSLQPIRSSTLEQNFDSTKKAASKEDPNSYSVVNVVAGIDSAESFHLNVQNESIQANEETTSLVQKPYNQGHDNDNRRTDSNQSSRQTSSLLHPDMVHRPHSEIAQHATNQDILSRDSDQVVSHLDSRLRQAPLQDDGDQHDRKPLARDILEKNRVRTATEQLQAVGLSRKKSVADQEAGSSDEDTVMSSAKSSSRNFVSQNEVSLGGLSNMINKKQVEGSHSAQGIPGSTFKTPFPSVQPKNKVLNKQFWMKDENARDCFACGDPFSTFRRKHHCRTCGQIFDAKCTTVISASRLGQTGTLRVCKPCEVIVKGEDDSSDFSEDSEVLQASLRPRHGSNGQVYDHAVPVQSPGAGDTSYRGAEAPDVGVPTMSIPATRKAGERANRKSTVLAIGPDRGLVRPASSRSLKTMSSNKQHSLGHRRHQSRHQHHRVFQPLNEDHAPFHQAAASTKSHEALTTFHDDNVIDPDLAPYLSDEASSGDEQVSIMTALNGPDSHSPLDDRQNFGSIARKLRSRLGEKSASVVSFNSHDHDIHGLSYVKTATNGRPNKRRNFSISSAMNSRPSPRSHRANTLNTSLALGMRDDTIDSPHVGPSTISIPGNDYRMIRSSSMRGTSAPPIELNAASLQHVGKLLHQLLIDSKIPSVKDWEKALIPILLRATDDVNPDVQDGDDIDIRHYVKLKKIPGGRPGDTSYVSGLVFTKNLALKSMPRTMNHPNILILTFPLEYARHQQHFMSLEPVIRQEREFLQNIVNRIAALRPHLLLVERHVSGLALEFLERANIATAYNVKASVLEAVSRCCQTRMISSIDKLAVKPTQAGKCASFALKTYLYQGCKKTYMFLSGCSKDLGCTIVLRGADTRTLKIIKNITEFMVYVVYNLKLETCLMRDESACIPSNVDIGSISRITTSCYADMGDRIACEKSNTEEQVIAPSIKNAVNPSITSGSIEVAMSNGPPSLKEEDSVPDDVPMPTFYGDMVEEHRTKILSASPFVKFMQPYLLMRAREQERRLGYLKRLRDQDISNLQTVESKAKAEKFDLIKPEMVHKSMPDASRKVQEVLHAVHDAEYDKALHIYQTQRKQWESYISGNVHLFDPFAHQNIAVLYSLVCTATTIPCAGPDLVALGFYNEHETDTDFEADCSLGQYVEDLCLGADSVCSSSVCGKRLCDHHRQYVHGEAQMSVFVEHYPCKIKGHQDTILMWSVCRKCGNETQVTEMSRNTWKYSFGKYLELSFWSCDLKPVSEACNHDLHRDHLRYFGLRDTAVRVQYDRIILLEIIVPRTRITWKVDNDLLFKNEVFGRIEERISKFMMSVKNRIKSINAESVLPEKIEPCKEEVERLLKKSVDDQQVLMSKLRQQYMNSKHYEIVPLNQIIRSTQELVADWDKIFTQFDFDFFPSEKDIRRLATLQLKKIFLDRDESVTSLTSTESSAGNAIDTLNNSAMQSAETLAIVEPTETSVDENNKEAISDIVGRKALQVQADDLDNDTQNRLPKSAEAVDLGLVQHLDLAIPAQSHVGPADAETNIKSEQGLRLAPAHNHPPPDGRSNPPGKEQEVEREHPAQISTDTAKSVQSSIPRSAGLSQATAVNICEKPSFARTHSQPVLAIGESPVALNQFLPQGSTQVMPEWHLNQLHASNIPTLTAKSVKALDRSIVDRLGLKSRKAGGISSQSMIPRSVNTRRKESRVSHLAKHFEQLSREFERERMKERRQRMAEESQSRALPVNASRPIVEVYRNVYEAVEEKEPSDEHLENLPVAASHSKKPHESTPDPVTVRDEQDLQEAAKASETADNTETDEATLGDSRVTSDNDGEGVQSEDDRGNATDTDVAESSAEPSTIASDEIPMDMNLELPKHERTSLMKILTNFWAERSASGWKPLDYPLLATDHIFADSDIIVREDEPSSLISFALDSDDYKSKLDNIKEKIKINEDNVGPEKYEDSFLDHIEQARIEETLLRPTGTHLKYQFSEGSAKMLCKVFYAEQFDAVRYKCGVSSRIVESLSRCMKWDSKGGKTKSVFLKTLDDRFVLKSLSTIETQAFLKFAPAYFRIMSESLFHELPSVIAKMLGFYQIIIKNPVTGVDFNWFLLIMENLFYDRSPTRIFDLKGSMRNRRIQSTGEQNEVLLDENMVEFIYESPLFVREHSKKLLRASVWNDTLFLSRQNVMDYSLMIAIDEDKRELVVGIIDCIRTYTWDKKLESWIKDRGKNRPTVTSPKEYKSRFREAMGRYVLQAPNCWHQFDAPQIESRSMKKEEPGDEKESRTTTA